MKLFLQKNAKFWRAGGSAPSPRASGVCGLCPQTPSLQRLGASSPDPQTAPPLQIAGYAPDFSYIVFKQKLLKTTLSK